MEDSERSRPLVSVCCTSYNLEELVSKMIQSIPDQDTTFNFEIIVHDDASTDETQHIINSFYEKYPNKIKRAFQETNLYTSHEGGLGYMFNNYILPEAEGDYPISYKNRWIILNKIRTIQEKWPVDRKANSNTWRCGVSNIYTNVQEGEIYLINDL